MWWWLLLCSAILHSRADSLSLHVILHEWQAFYSAFLNIHRSGVLTALAWLVPHETAAVSAQVLCTPYNHASCHFMQSHIRKVYASLAVTCHLHFWQWPGSFTYCYERRVSTENRPWRRKFSRRSCRDSNPRPFNHESGALTTELSPPPERDLFILASERITCKVLWLNYSRFTYTSIRADHLHLPNKHVIVESLETYLH